MKANGLKYRVIRISMKIEKFGLINFYVFSNSLKYKTTMKMIFKCVLKAMIALNCIDLYIDKNRKNW